MADVLVGTCGYVYEHWRGVFYPEHLPQKDFFLFYARTFRSVEINFTFYHLPTEKNVADWREAAPSDFIYSLKAPRKITHEMRLSRAAGLARVFIRRAKELKEHLGAILFQLPPSLKADRSLLAEFFVQLPSGCRYVFEFRDDTWLTDSVFALLEDYRVALCINDAPSIQAPDLATADFVYYRLHGRRKWVYDCYSEEELRSLAGRVLRHAGEGRDVYVYFNNDAKGYAVQNAQSLLEYLSDG